MRYRATTGQAIKVCRLKADDGDLTDWNPLTSDCDALRLATALGLDVQFFRSPTEVHASTLNDVPVRSAIEPHGDDRGAATRRAITRAAAAIGETTP